MKAYKGFDKNMKCRDFQYEEGKTYEHPGTPNLCHEGFHACEGPLDVLAYYSPSEGGYFHEVELDGVTDQRADDTKVCGKKITIGARLTLAQLIKAGIDFRFSKTTTEKDIFNKERYGAASATGKASCALAAGYDCIAQGAIGCALFLTERDGVGDIIHVAAVIVDGKDIKADTWYQLKDGKIEIYGE